MQLHPGEKNNTKHMGSEIKIFVSGWDALKVAALWKVAMLVKYRTC